MKTIAEVAALIQSTRPLPLDIADFKESQSVRTETMSPGGRALLTYFKPFLERTDWESGNFGMAAGYRKQVKETAQLAACHAMLNRLRVGAKQLAREAATAGTDLPTFTRQLLLTITRAYSRLFTLQLFGVIPLTGPNGRIHFKDYLYDSNFAGTAANPTPTISQGDRTDDTTKFNVDYYAAPEGAIANHIRFKYSNLDFSVSDKRVVGEWTDSFADDAASVYGEDAEQAHMDHMSQEMSRVVDRDMVASVINNVPSANSYTWTAQPTGAAGTPNYSTLDVANRREYDQTLVTDGVQSVLNKIMVSRKYQNDGMPDWMIVGTDFSLALMKCTSFAPINMGQEMQINTGALRDFGQLTGLGIRVLVDPLLTISSSSKVALFGRKPKAKNDVGHYWAPYVNLQPTRSLYDPETGTTVEGVRSRYAVVKPNTGSNASSSQLADVYGKLTIG